MKNQYRKMIAGAIFSILVAAILVVPTPPVSNVGPTFWNCEGCCGSYPSSGNQGEINAWRGCMNECETSARQGVIYSCAETSQDETVLASLSLVPTAEAQVQDEPLWEYCQYAAQQCNATADMIIVSCQAAGTDYRVCHNRAANHYNNCIESAGCGGVQQPRQLIVKPY